MKLPIPYAYGWFSRWMNTWYWSGLRGLTSLQCTSRDVLELIDTLDKLTYTMSTITYKANALFGAVYWWPDPITTIARGCGDCKAFVRLWYDRLTAMDYDATVYILFKKFCGIELPWHFVCVWDYSDGMWMVASNTESDMVGWHFAEGDAIDLYIREYNYSSAKPLSHKDITGRTV